jgi:glutamine synthetase
MESVNTAGKTALNYLADLDQKGKIVAEYVWIGGTMSLRSKCRTLPGKVTNISEIPEWNYDGSSTY